MAEFEMPDCCNQQGDSKHIAMHQIYDIDDKNDITEQEIKSLHTPIIEDTDADTLAFNDKTDQMKDLMIPLIESNFEDQNQNPMARQISRTLSNLDSSSRKRANS